MLREVRSFPDNRPRPKPELELLECLAWCRKNRATVHFTENNVTIVAPGIKNSMSAHSINLIEAWEAIKNHLKGGVA